MGIYVNPRNDGFKGILKRGTYVDKTMMLSVLNQYIDSDNKYICISRPRRFGKTIAGEMISAYYSRGCDSSDLFNNLKISKAEGYEEKLNKYNVIKIDMNSEYQNTENKRDTIKELKNEIKYELVGEYPDVHFLESDSVAKCIQKVHQATGDTFIILVDEYDVLVREQVNQELFDEFLSFLNGLFKSAILMPAISLAYLTGILPIVRDKIQSKLNNFEEYTIVDASDLTEFTGFTDEEVQSLCDKYNMDFDECKNWYNGYRLNNYDIYNPESVIKAMKNEEYGSYWGKTSSYEVISDRIRCNYDGMKDSVIRMMAGESVKVDMGKYLNTMDSFKDADDAFTYLIHVGYLAYDVKTGTCRIPNGEVRKEWKYAISVETGYETTAKIIKASEELLEETINGNEEAVAHALDTTHIHVTSNRSYNNEDALGSAIYLAYIYALNEYNAYKELTTGKGFADVVYVPIHPDRPALIIELKHNKTAESAIYQIKDKKYFDALSNYSGNLLFVGISYDEGNKTHDCKIERFVVD